MYSAGAAQEAGKGNRIAALFESLRNEIEGAANEANVYRQQRDECERKRKYHYSLLLSPLILPSTSFAALLHSMDLLLEALLVVTSYFFSDGQWRLSYKSSTCFSKHSWSSSVRT